MNPQSEVRRLNRQRNIAATAAAAIIAAGLAVCLPRALERRARLKSANDELLALQGQIESTQMQIRGVQAQIIQAQSEIRLLVHEPH
jgi:septal ring factor EnvC (AmiA/AmiB activator)